MGHLVWYYLDVEQPRSLVGTTLAGTAGLCLLGISIAFGLSVVVFAYAIGGVSGCHINPAVTIGLLVAGKITMKETVVYIIAQILGAILGAFVLAQILSGQLAGFTAGEWAYGSNGWGKGHQNEYGVVAAFLTEAVLTTLFLCDFSNDFQSRQCYNGRSGNWFDFIANPFGCYSRDWHFC